jgi:choloylglycine hydrolase
VEEVVATDKVIRINREGAVPLHFLVADAKGMAATIEFLNGKMVVHKGKDLPYPVLTNTVYQYAVQRLNTKPSSEWASFGDNSVKRFATACQLIQQFQQANTNQSPVDFSFQILDKIAQGDYTKWSIVYDITGKQIHFITKDNRQRMHLALNDFNFTCNKSPIAFNLNKRVQGPISQYFLPLSFVQNKSIIEQSARESQSQVTLGASTIAGIADYFNRVQCK